MIIKHIPSDLGCEWWNIYLASGPDEDDSHVSVARRGDEVWTTLNIGRMTMNLAELNRLRDALASASDIVMGLNKEGEGNDA